MLCDVITLLLVAEYDKVFDARMDSRESNEDGTYNITASLVLEPYALLDGAKLGCTAYVTDDDKTVSSVASDPLTVYREFFPLFLT